MMQEFYKGEMGIKGKKALVFGIARSGVGAANLLVNLGAKVTVTDRKSREGLTDFLDRLLPSVNLALGGHPDEIFKDTDLIVVSPGVPLDIHPLKKARAAGIKIIGELELAYQIVSSQQSALSQKTKFLAVTGTNGKSTTTTLLDFMLKKGGIKTILGGNIGSALSEEINNWMQATGCRVQDKEDIASCIVHHASLAPDYIVAEVSSFQLESIDTFGPKGAAILNVTPDHMDRYHSMNEYSDAKAKIFLNQQRDDFLVLNADDAETMKVEKEKVKVKNERPRVFYFSRKKEVEGVYFKDGTVYCNLPIMVGTVPILPPSAGKSGTVPFPLIRADDIKIKGVHNLENAMAASAMALLAKCPADAVADALKDFQGLEHRLEFVRRLDGVDYINDSKGTNAGAVIKSLESFTEPLILIAGGRDKAGDFSVLAPLIKDRVKTLVLIGEAREKMKKALGDMTETKLADDLNEAVMLSRKSALSGDVVLLSPACASFDMFRDFEDRGRQFKKIVKGLA